MIPTPKPYWGTVGFADVESLNVVGYAQKTCPANRFQHAAAQFEDVSSGKLSLDTVFSGLPAVAFDNSYVFMGTAPHIQVVKADGTPDKYYYLNDGYYEVDGAAAYKAGWCDSSGNLVDVKIPAQGGFWVKAASGAFTFNYKR